MKLHHIALMVSNKAKSQDFYIKILGFSLLRETFREERGSWKVDLQKGDIRLEMFTFPDFVKRPSYPEALGLRHMAFEIIDVEKFHRELLEKGVESVEKIRVDEMTGKKFFFFPDPDGLPIEIYEA